MLVILSRFMTRDHLFGCSINFGLAVLLIPIMKIINVLHYSLLDIYLCVIVFTDLVSYCGKNVIVLSWVRMIINYSLT